MRNVMGRVHSVESFGALDGPGLRYVLFLQGCPFRCVYCHNPDSWDREAGQRVSSVEAVEDILRYRHFIKAGGVTLSGGEPLFQPEFAAAVLEGCRENGLHTALDTAGALPPEKCREALDAADLLLLDFKAGEDTLFRKITGAGMANTLAALDYREQSENPVWIRHVLVPGLTLTESNLRTLGKLLQPYRCVERIELLPFHKMGEYKWGPGYTLTDTPEPTTAEMAWAKKILGEYLPKVV